MSCIAIGIAASVAANCFGVLPVDAPDAQLPERTRDSQTIMGTCEVVQTKPGFPTIAGTSVGLLAAVTVGAVAIRRRRT